MKRISLILLVFFTACDYVQYQQGKDLYVTHCAHCHMEDGSGVEDLYPAMKDMDVRIDELPCIITQGINHPETLLEMVAIEGLSDVEVSNISNYIMSDMNGRNEELTIKRTKTLLSQCTSQ